MRFWGSAPLRLRLTAAFALSMAAVLAGLGGFLHVRLGAELLGGVDLELRSRAGVIGSALAGPGRPPVDAGRDVIDPDEAFAQVLDLSGHIVDASLAVRARPLMPARALRGLTAPRFLTSQVPGVDDPARLLVVPVTTAGRSAVIVVGANLGDRNEALGRLQLLLTLGIPAALVVASAAGWLVAGAALRPVDSLRSEAATISGSTPGSRLSVPPTGDELARLADTLNLLLDRQQEALDREHRFVDEASHELRTPLAIVKAELDLAASRPRSHPELTATITAVTAQTDRLVVLAEHLLVLARSRSGHEPLQREPIRLRHFLQESAAAVHAQAAAAGTTVTVDLPEGSDRVVRCDAFRLEQAVHNLLDNALRYGTGTQVTVTSRHSSGHVTITVTDGGPGFSAETLQRAFEPFVRGTTNRADGPPSGTGLGLAIVRAVAEAHGGHAQAGNLGTGGARVVLHIDA